MRDGVFCYSGFPDFFKRGCIIYPPWTVKRMSLYLLEGFTGMKSVKTMVLGIVLGGGFAVAALAQYDHFPQFMDNAKRAYMNEKYDLALEYYQSAIEDKSDGWQAYVGLGNCYYYMKKPKEALKAYEKALSINPDNPTLVRFVQALRARMGVLLIPPTPTPARFMPTPTPTWIPLPPP
jgi:hypothetical protein